MPLPDLAATSTARVLVLVAHPDLPASRVNRRMLAAARQLQPTAGERMVVRDLYALYPDYLIDVKAEQRAAAAADLIVWQLPIHWYSTPPLLKLWLDEVLTLGWAYGPGGRALADKDLWLVCSTGGGADAYHPSGYNRYFFDAFLPPFEQTAALTGMRFLPPLVLHGAHAADEPTVAAHVQGYMDHLVSYPAWPELAALPARLRCETPTDDRPPASGAPS